MFSEQADAMEPGKAYRLRPRLTGARWVCGCGRDDFTTARGRNQHRRNCQPGLAVLEWENAAIIRLLGYRNVPKRGLLIST